MKITNLSKKFASKVIFDNDTFEFPDGKVTYLIGESGIGKTTLLRIIAGLDKEFSGEITSISNKISYVFQEPRLFPNLNVEENISLVAEDSCYSVKEILSLMELENEQNSLPSSLSGGMKMRIALARAIYNDGDIFLMDEPFSALDDELKARLLPKVFDYLKGKTIIIVSHNLDEANKFADKIINFNTTLNHK